MAQNITPNRLNKNHLFNTDTSIQQCIEDKKNGMKNKGRRSALREFLYQISLILNIPEHFQVLA